MRRPLPAGACRRIQPGPEAHRRAGRQRRRAPGGPAGHFRYRAPAGMWASTSTSPAGYRRWWRKRSSRISPARCPTACSMAIYFALGEFPGTASTINTAASPVTYITPDDPPFLIIHGEKDGYAPVEQAQTLDARLKAAGVSSKLVIVQNGEHGLTSCEWGSDRAVAGGNKPDHPGFFECKPDEIRVHWKCRFRPRSRGSSFLIPL